MTRRSLVAWLVVCLVSPLVAWVWVGLGRPLAVQGGWPLTWALVGSPVLEEWVYRAGVQTTIAVRLSGRLAPHAPHWANLFTALLFVAVHAPAHGVWAWAWIVPGLLLGELFRQTQLVWPCVGLHAWFNLSLFAASGMKF